MELSFFAMMIAAVSYAIMTPKSFQVWINTHPRAMLARVFNLLNIFTTISFATLISDLFNYDKPMSMFHHRDMVPADLVILGIVIVPQIIILRKLRQPMEKHHEDRTK